MSTYLPKLGSDLRRALFTAINDVQDQEICGLLVETGIVLSFRRIRNLGGPGEFWLDQIALDRVLRNIVKNEGVVRGFVHSHAMDPNLSVADRHTMRSSVWPWLVIVQRRNEIEGKWFWNEGNRIAFLTI
jgi:proteasome lid subunit RPN8/RPN11